MKRKRRVLVLKRSHFAVMMMFLRRKTKMTYLTPIMSLCVNMIRCEFLKLLHVEFQ